MRPVFPKSCIVIPVFHFEATLIYLKQCDEQFDLKVMEMDEMKEAIESLKAELPADDTSSFSFDKKGDGDSDKDNTSGVITIDSLFRHVR